MQIASATLRAIPVAVTGWIASANASAWGGISERRDVPANEAFKQILKDEGLENLWQFFSSSVLSNLVKESGLRIPEPLVIVPGKFIGSAWHWLSASGQSLNKSVTDEGRNENKELSLPEKFHKDMIDGPARFIFDILGLEKEDTTFATYALSQLGVFGAASLILKQFDDEHLPGIKVDQDNTTSSNILNSLGYIGVEYLTNASSQVARFYIDFKDQFGKNALPKALANAVNEKLVPGHFLSAICGCISTYSLGKYIPKTTAAAIGEFPMKLFNRFPNAHRRRATKEVEDQDGNILLNSRTHPKVANLYDKIFNPVREKMISTISLLTNVPISELKESFEVADDNLREVELTEVQRNKLSLEREKNPEDPIFVPFLERSPVVAKVAA